MNKDADAYRTISEVAGALDIPPHVLRFWETKFPQVKPLKRGGGRRFYRRGDVELLRAIRHLLYEDAYTIRGVQRLLKSRGVADVAGMASGTAPAARADPAAVAGSASPDRALLAQLAAEIAGCQAILAEALGAPAMGSDGGATRPPPAAAAPAAPASAAPPP